MQVENSQVFPKNAENQQTNTFRLLENTEPRNIAKIFQTHQLIGCLANIWIDNSSVLHLTWLVTFPTKTIHDLQGGSGSLQLVVDWFGGSVPVDSNGCLQTPGPETCFWNENPREVMIQQHLIKRMNYLLIETNNNSGKWTWHQKKGWFVKEIFFLYKHVLSTVPVCFGGVHTTNKQLPGYFLD